MTFANETTRTIFGGNAVAGLSAEIQVRALERLQLLDAAADLGDLAAAKQAGLHVHEERRGGVHCICVDERGRICFRWRDGHAYDVELFGYH